MPTTRVACFLLLLLPSLTAAYSVPVVFHAETPVARRLAHQCEQVWNEHGSALVAALVPEEVAPDTVHCLVLDSRSFDRHFADRLPDWGVGVAVPPGRLIALDYERLPSTGPGPEAVFVHEMTHALLFQAAGGARLPTWLHEGAAMRASGEWRVADTVAMAMSGRVPSLHALDGPFPRGGAGAQAAYRTSLLAVTWLERQHGPGAVPRIVAAARRTGDFHSGFLAATGEAPDEFARRFAGAMRLRFGWFLLLFRWPTLFVIMALVFVFGALRKIIINRRLLREVEDDEDIEPR